MLTSNWITHQSILNSLKLDKRLELKNNADENCIKMPLVTRDHVGAKVRNIDVVVREQLQCLLVLEHGAFVVLLLKQLVAFFPELLWHGDEHRRVFIEGFRRFPGHGVWICSAWSNGTLLPCGLPHLWPIRNSLNRERENWMNERIWICCSERKREQNRTTQQRRLRHYEDNQCLLQKHLRLAQVNEATRTRSKVPLPMRWFNRILILKGDKVKLSLGYSFTTGHGERLRSTILHM